MSAPDRPRFVEGARVAVVGTGISGLVCAHVLQRRHTVTVFEAADYAGGHTNTVDVDWDGERYAIDTGFIVFNDRTYPNFRRLLNSLGIGSQPTTMSFSVRCERTGLEYSGSGLSGLFAQPRNLLRPRFYGMIGDILRFHRQAPLLLEEPDSDLTLGRFLDRGRFGREFQERYLVPMGAAIWSSQPDRMLEMPAEFFVRFFHNHGMLQVKGRPEWHVVRGGSRSYVDELLSRFTGELRLRSPVSRVRRVDGGVTVTVPGGEERFDAVVLATHSDQSLRMLADARPLERHVLGAIPYQENEAVLHVDSSLMPRRRRAWAAWNYHLTETPADRVAVTYNMNILQSLDAPVQFCVTLNRGDGIDPDKVLKRITYDHPVFTSSGVDAQEHLSAINGARGIWFCGAWCGYGFHEDGVNAALAVCKDFGLDITDASGEAAA